MLYLVFFFSEILLIYVVLVKEKIQKVEGHQRCSKRNFVLKYSAIFTGNHLCESLLSIKLKKRLLKKRLQNRCFPINIAKFLRTSILKNIYKLLLLKIHVIFFPSLLPNNIIKLLSRLLWINLS